MRVAGVLQGRLKSEVSVARLVQASGTLLKKSGKDWLGGARSTRTTRPALW